MTLSDKQWSIRDLGSQNGTFVNDVKLQGDLVLDPGDVIRIGPMVLEFSPPQAGSPTPTSAGKAAKSNTTDDDIASWLTEGEPEDGSTGDTTIISTASKAVTKPIPADTASAVDVAAGSQAKGQTAKEQAFQSVAEEAADIIRHHWEHVKREEDDGDAPA